MIDTQEIVRLEKEADDLELSADGKRYEAAHLISEALTEGWTQRSLAERIGKSVSHVNKCAKIWQEYGSVSPENRPTWRDAYRARSGKGKPEVPKEPRTPATDIPVSSPGSALERLQPAAVVAENFRARGEIKTAEDVREIVAWLHEVIDNLGLIEAELSRQETGF